MLVRPMTKEDIPQVSAIENETFSLPWKPHDFLSMIQNDDNIYLVAETNEQIVGYCGFIGIMNQGHISNVAVVKEYHHKGIAYGMLIELINMGRQRDIDAFTLEVRIGNEKAINLYKKLGFRNSGIRPNFYAYPREDALIMWLHFDP